MNMNKGVAVPVAAVARQMAEDARQDLEGKGEELMAKISEQAELGYNKACGAVSKVVSDRYVEALEGAGYEVEVISSSDDLEQDPYDTDEMLKIGLTEDDYENWDEETEVLILVDWS